MVRCLSEVALKSKAVLLDIVTEECVDAANHVDDMVEFLGL